MKSKLAIFGALLSCFLMLGQANAQNSEQTRELVLRFINGYWNAEDLSVVDDLIGEKFINYAPSNRFEGHMYTPEEIRAARESFRNLMPDLRYTVEDVIVEDSRAMVRATARFRHINPIPAAPFGEAVPTDATVSYAVIFIYHFENQKITEGWDLYDAMHRYSQLGVLPAN